jgi:hypothetical protein
MNDIDPAKMTDTERTALFASFTQGMTPALPPRQTVTRLLAPWIAAIRAQRAAGYDWKQLAQICDTKLQIKLSPRTLQNVVLATSKSRKARPAVARPEAAAKPAKAPA